MSRLEIESGAFQSLSKTNVAADVRRRICGQVVQFLSLQPVHNSFFIRRGEMGNLPQGIPKEAGVRLLRMRKAVSRMRAFISKGEVNVVVETPKGSRVKYAFDPESGFFELRRALPEGMMFPFNFGFIPGTKADDGDPLDILILNQEPLFPGCLLKARLIGVIKAEQTENGETTRNDRLIGIAIGEQTPSSLKGAAREMETFSQVEHFFISYNQLSGKKFRVIGRRGRGEALALVRKSQTKSEPSENKA